jgi:hypothetical protein
LRGKRRRSVKEFIFSIFILKREYILDVTIPSMRLSQMEYAFKLKYMLIVEESQVAFYGFFDNAWLFV